MIKMTRDIQLQMHKSQNLQITFEVCKAKEMVLHEANVSHHHIKNVFANCLKVTAQLQFLPIQEHNTHLPLCFFHLVSFRLLGMKQQ